MGSYGGAPALTGLANCIQYWQLSAMPFVEKDDFFKQATGEFCTRKRVKGLF